MNIWLKICFSLLLSSVFHGASLNTALDELREDPYGFVLCEVGITPLDLKHFSSIDIQREWVYHQFGELELIEGSIANFIREIGSNEYELSLDVSSRLKEIINCVIESSGKETAWICLRSFIPISRYDIPRWHVDGPYYTPDGADLPFKFVVTLVGPSTLFYPISLELRKTTEKSARNKQFMKSLCKEKNIVSPILGQGAVFRSGQYTGVSALHSEPPIHESRLFLSIVPCSQAQLPILKARVMVLYPKSSTK